MTCVMTFFAFDVLTGLCAIDKSGVCHLYFYYTYIFFLDKYILLILDIFSPMTEKVIYPCHIGLYDGKIAFELDSHFVEKLMDHVRCLWSQILCASDSSYTSQIYLPNKTVICLFGVSLEPSYSA